MTILLLASVESRMRNTFRASQQGENLISKAALDHLEAGGSRVRASLCLDAALKLGLDQADAITLASICELLHNASLIQDDLLDRAALRRGRPSVWAAYNDGTAVCAGDLLLAGAFGLVGELRCVKHVVPALSLVLSRTQEVILGQGKELDSPPDTLEGYEVVAIGKSASLLSLPLELPLLVSGNTDFLEVAHRVAERFATAYQMVDDLADYDEDARNGALNVVSVAQGQYRQNYESACELVCSRAEELIQVAIEDAGKLPENCGSGVVAYAERLGSALQAHRSSLMHSREPSHNGR